MISQIQLSALLIGAAIIWGVLLILDGVSVSVQFLKPLSTVTGVLVLLLAFFERWAWRLPLLYPWFVSVPNLQGTWKGQLTSTWVDPKTYSQIPPREAYLVIKQTFSAIHIRLITNESSSESLAGKIMRNSDGAIDIAATYRNTPKILMREKSPIHFGGLLMHVHGQPPHTLEGQYWTDRGTQGEIQFTSKSKRQYSDFASAAAGKYVVGKK